MIQFVFFPAEFCQLIKLITSVFFISVTSSVFSTRALLQDVSWHWKCDHNVEHVTQMCNLVLIRGDQHQNTQRLPHKHHRLRIYRPEPLNHHVPGPREDSALVWSHEVHMLEAVTQSLPHSVASVSAGCSLDLRMADDHDLFSSRDIFRWCYELLTMKSPHSL